MSDDIDVTEMTEDEIRSAVERAAEADRYKSERDAAHALIAKNTGKRQATGDEELSPGEALTSTYLESKARGTPNDYAQADAIRASTEAQIRKAKGTSLAEERAARAAQLEAELNALRAE